MFSPEVGIWRRRRWRRRRKICGMHCNKLNDIGSERDSRERIQDEIAAVFFHDQVRQGLGPARLHFCLSTKPVHRFGKFRRNNRQDAEQREARALSHHVGPDHKEILLLQPHVGVVVDLEC